MFNYGVFQNDMIIGQFCFESDAEIFREAIQIRFPNINHYVKAV